MGRISKARRIKAAPAGEVARLYRHLARVRAEAEAALAHAERAEALLSKAFNIDCGEDREMTLAMMRHVFIEAGLAYRFRGLIRTIQMAEEGTLCA
ncbi:hypothetical protein MKK65_29450 [Methylobacterium sp. J-001]|uniref:hypothetical protein n=1 Tax=Methylobacterium sp. J-001 TaxID=2836609 RepID=UPI001FB92239|nr:hypothetical protein [Methylobacterium sp. J-001]MCJ2120635.1 hypothetical protein [Methylobacterium sp. J-001]